MAYKHSAGASPSSTVTSIASILEDAIKPSSSEDRLSFHSVFKDYSLEGKEQAGQRERTTPNFYFRAISPKPAISQSLLVRAPSLGRAKLSMPSIYQQMAASELDLLNCGAMAAFMRHRERKKETDDSESSDLPVEETTPDLIDLSDCMPTPQADVNGRSDSDEDSKWDTIKRMNPTSSSPRADAKADNVTVEENSKSEPSDAKAETINDLLSLVWVPKPVTLPTVQREDNPVYSRKPTLPTIEEGGGKPRERNVNPARRLHFQESADQMSFDSTCPVHGVVNDVMTTLANPRAFEESLTSNLKSAKLKPSTVMSKSSLEGKKYKQMAGQDKKPATSSNDLLNDEDYHSGVVYPCKYIGSMSMMKPTTKDEILSAMRRVRIEYKARNTKKKKILMEIGVGGVKVRLNKKGRKDSKDMMLMEEPISHIFYVSHDSHDNKIFSYISKKNPALRINSSTAKVNLLSQQSEPSTFHCHVFKAFKKMQAVLIVQGLGRIFTICQYLPSPTDPHPTTNNSQGLDAEANSDNRQSLDDSVFLSDDKVTEKDSKKSNSNFTHSKTSKTKEQPPAEKPNSAAGESKRRQPLMSKQRSCDDLLLSNKELKEDGALTPQQEMQLLWLQVEHQEQQISLAVGETEVLRQQVAIETQARSDAEIRCHQLLLHNKDLLEHINRLVVENKQLKEKLSHHSEHNSTQPILSSTRTASPRTEVKGETTTSVKTSPDSGHKEMSARSSQSELLDEWEKINATLHSIATPLHALTTPTNSSYQLSSKFENEMMQRKLSIGRDYSFTDMAKMRLSQSQLTSCPADGSEQAGQANGASVSNRQPLKLSNGVRPHDVSNGIGDDQLHIANQSFSDVPVESPVIPHSRIPDATKLLSDLMLNSSTSSTRVSHSRPNKSIYLDRMQACDPETRARSLNSNVNDIYDKMKVIRRSLENMESSVSRHLSNVASVPADDYTPQRKRSVASSTPTSTSAERTRLRQEEYAYADIGERRSDRKSKRRDSDDNIYEPVERRTDRDADRKTSKQSRTSGDFKFRRSHHYENVPDHFPCNQSKCRSSLRRNETYLVRRSSVDLQSKRPTQDQPVFDRNRLAYRSCQSLGNPRTTLVEGRYPYAPQKVTTLVSPATVQNRHGIQGMATVVKSGSRRNSAHSPYFDTSKEVEGARGNQSHESSSFVKLTREQMINGQATNMEFVHSFSPVVLHPGVSYKSQHCDDWLSRSGPVNNDFQPISSYSALAISKDSLESSVFEEEYVRRIVELPGTTGSHSSC